MPVNAAPPIAVPVVLAPGACAAQARLLAEVGIELERRDAAIDAALAAGDAPAVRRLLERPLRIVVPSRPLRDRVSAALLAHCGASLAAVVVHTHWALALAVVERAEARPPGGEELFRLLVQRFAAEEPLLLEALGELEQGYGIALATARDLVDAGFAPGSAEALDEALGELGTPAAERTRAVARVTARALAELDAEQRAPRAALLERACDALRADESLLPASAIWIHGFADATGVVADWIETLQRTRRARVLLSIPPDPFDSAEAESEFSQRFALRVASAAGETIRADVVPAPSLALLRAPGAIAEVRAVAVRIRALLDAGVAPESIGVVARSLDAHRAAIGAQFARLAIPFSAPGAVASADLRARRLGATVTLLARGERTPVDTWLAASPHGDAFDGDLRVGLHVLGAAHLDDLARLDPARVFAERDFLTLPVRRGADEEERPDDDGEARRVRRVRSRTLDRKRLEAAHGRACALVDRMAKWPAQADFATHRERLDGLLGADLGWSRDDASLAPVLASLQALGDAVPASFALGRAEFAALVERALAADPGAAVGGAGAGVAVLSVMAARGCCFEHLFVLGLNRDVFPRTPNEDPLVPDAVRRALRAVLPELPVKGDGRAEERHLFAELLASSPHVTLSWQYVTDEGRELARSSFVERLCLVDRSLAVDSAPQALGTRESDESLRPAHEHAVRAALYGSRAELAPLRRAALDDVRTRLGADALDVDALARVQLAILDELDPDLRTRAGRQRAARLGPWFGYAGAAPASELDASLFVTRIEALARCPWQAFLRKTLGLQSAPDALDALPALSPLVVGNALHALLQRVVEDVLGASADASLAAALARGPVRVPWPDAERLGAIALQEAERVAEQEGVRIPGFARALAKRALGMADVARRLDWSDPAGLAVLGAELGGEVGVADAAGRMRRIGFRVDRADLADGLLRLTDYKSGKPVSTATGEATQREHLLAAVQQGRALQGVAYLAGVRSQEVAQVAGRLLYLREELDDRLRSFAAQREDEALVGAFEATARSVFAANDAGTFFPRLVLADDDKEPNACDWCEVSAACLRGESGQRARLRRWAEAFGAGDPSDRALFGLFSIGREPAESAS